MAGARNLKPNRNQSGSSWSNNLDISIQSDSGHGKGREKNCESQKKGAISLVGGIREGCTEEVLFDLVLEAEEKFYSRRKEGIIFEEEQHVSTKPSPFPEEKTELDLAGPRLKRITPGHPLV